MNELRKKDFKVRYYFELIPRRSGNISETYKIFKFYDYAPHVFQQIRNKFGITNRNYLQSIGTEQMIRNLMKSKLNTLNYQCSSGKSGSFFYYTSDGRFLLKTMTRTEFKFLKKILRKYYEYILDNPRTLITKFFGLHKIWPKTKRKRDRGSKFYFLIMENIFNTQQEIHTRYDIKGSLYKRETKEHRK